MTELRIGDLERDRAADELSGHFAAGRLDHSEFDSRLAAAYAAKTGADLEPLFADLPGHQPAVPTGPTGHAVQHQHQGHGFFPLFPIVMLILIGASVAAITHGFPPVFLFVAFFMMRGRRRHYRAGRPGGY